MLRASEVIGAMTLAQRSIVSERSQRPIGTQTEFDIESVCHKIFVVMTSIRHTTLLTLASTLGDMQLARNESMAIATIFVIEALPLSQAFHDLSVVSTEFPVTLYCII